MSLPRPIDYGTPAKESDKYVTLEIDGAEITVPAGTSIMRAAQMIEHPIPKLCATDSIDAFGSCRLCLVEIEGRRGYPASCTTPADNGLKVKTQTPKLAEIRKGVMELYFSDHPFSDANVITTDNSDWATNCPEYKVTAVQIVPVTQPSEWQRNYSRFNRLQPDLLEQAKASESVSQV